MWALALGCLLDVPRFLLVGGLTFPLQRERAPWSGDKPSASARLFLTNSTTDL
jgi:hypothetical protein